MEKLDFSKIKKVTSVKAVDKELLDDESAIIHFITTPDVDEGNEVLNPMGMDASYFLLTKSVFYMHMYSRPPIGKNVMLNPTKDGVIAKTVCSKTDFGKEIYQLHKEDVIRNWSVGLDYEKSEDRDGIRYIDKWRLYEYSSAPFPMNPHALDIAKTICKSLEMTHQIEKVELEMRFIDRLNEQDVKIKDLMEKINNSDNKELEQLKQDFSKFQKDILGNVGKRFTPQEVKELFVGAFRNITGKKLKLN